METYLQEKGIPETFRGQAWSDHCREWVYFDCVLDVEALKSRLQLPGFVEKHENTDLRSGTELGLVCTECYDAIMGLHPAHALLQKAQVVD